MATITGVPTDMSDLFFNTSHSDARAVDFKTGEFAGWLEDVLAEEAGVFLHGLERLGVSVPEPEALVADFMARC